MATKKQNTTQNKTQAAPAKVVEKPSTLQAEAKKEDEAAKAAAAPVSKKKVKKHLLENTTDHLLDINFVDANGDVRSVSVPPARFIDEKKTNGWSVVDINEIEGMKQNAVVAAYFADGHLVDAGEVGDDVELKTSEDE